MSIFIREQHTYIINNGYNNVSSSLIGGLACVFSTQFCAARGPCESLPAMLFCYLADFTVLPVI